MLFVILALLILIGLLFPKSKIITGLMFLFMVVTHPDNWISKNLVRLDCNLLNLCTHIL